MSSALTSIQGAPTEAGDPQSGRVPSLDGLRAISISLVLLSHLNRTRGFENFKPGIGDYGHLGVLVFFVISGFLITRLLHSEYKDTRSVSLKRFYARRCLRLFPAAYVYIAFLSILTLAGVVHVGAADFWHAATYTMNYRPQPAWEIGHLWSLSVEEQFYLLWPCAFVLLKPRRARWALAGVILLGPAARAFNRFILIETPYEGLEMFPMVADSLATGCLLAEWSDWLERQSWYLWLFQPACSAALLGLILICNRYMGYTAFSTLGTSAINVSLAILVHRSVFYSRDWFGRFLNWRLVSFVGVLSYSLYLWQEPFLSRSNAWINAFPQNLALTVAASLGSYLLLERPLLALRQHFRPQRDEEEKTR